MSFGILIKSSVKNLKTFKDLLCISKTFQRPHAMTYNQIQSLSKDRYETWTENGGRTTNTTTGGD